LRLAGLSAPLLVAPTFIATGHAANAMGARVLGIGAAVMGLLVFARLLVVFRERESIDQARLSAQAQLAEMAYRDPLTGIANRYALYDAVDAGVEAAAGGESGLAILFVDLDGFKSVNDRFGHAEGDEVLRAVAARLRKAVRDHDVVARHGGDEFVVMMSGLPSAEARELAELLAGRLTAALAPPFDVNGSECIVGVTIGLSVYPADGTSADELIDAADRSMYRGKGIVAEDRRGITLAS
jgi:diguanylate cyclase (GGDEF)-like protein